jgi:hypothetical protein
VCGVGIGAWCQWPVVMFCWNEAMPTVIRALKARSDVHAIVAMVHWGGAVRYDQGGDRYTAAINEGEIAAFFMLPSRF